MVAVKKLFISFFILLCDNVFGDHAKAYKITMCDSNAFYPVIVDNVVIEEKYSKIFVSGSISTDDNLASPIKASITLKRYVDGLNVWLEVPCIGNFGSCTYYDLCSYGISRNETCPSNFIENAVPCRCPISPGRYTMKPENKMYLFTLPKTVHLLKGKVSTPASGTYWVEVKVYTGNIMVSCYDLYVDYNDKTEDIDNEVVPVLQFVR